MPKPQLHAKPEGDYILGTEEDEVQRLGLQHLVWRPRVTDAWRRAGFTVGQHIADIGCGPGYATWRLAPPRPDFEEFVQMVMKSWREKGGEPDIALDLVSWLPEEGFEIQELRPIVDVVSPADFLWQWPSTFVEVGLARLVRLGHIPENRAAAVRDVFRAAEKDPNTRLVTPGVLEIIARST